MRAQFEVLVARGGAKVDNPDNRDLLSAWFDALNKETATTEFGSSAETLEDGRPARTWGKIHRIREASATFCHRLEYRALEAERLAKVEIVPSETVKVRRPNLPLEVQAAIERTREQISLHARVTWRMLLNPSIFDSMQNPMAPRMPRPGSLKLEIQEYSAALFDGEKRARHNTTRSMHVTSPSCAPG